MIGIVKIVSNPPGRDTRDRLNEEYVVIGNRGIASVYLSGWMLKDAKGHRYVFPRTLSNGEMWRLDPREIAVVHTGSGTDCYVAPSSGRPGTFHFYWGSAWFIWNNEGDTAYLFDQAGNLIDSKTVGRAA